MTSASTSSAVVLVHGNFLGPWSWDDVAARLRDRDIHTHVVDLPSADPSRRPLGDLHVDAATVRELLDTLPLPVLVCGHSYGGAVITQAAAGPHPSVRHLVYLAGAVPDVGDSLASLAAVTPAPAVQDSDIAVEAEAVRVREDGLLELLPQAARASLFNDCDTGRAQHAIDQLRPSSPATGAQPLSGAAWRDIPATFVRGALDRMPELTSPAFLHADIEVVTLPTGHCPNWSRPDLVAELLIRRAAGSSPNPAGTGGT